GAFGEVSGAPFRGTMGGTAILADVDKDSDLDLFTVGTQGPMLYLNDGSGTFAEGTQLFGLGVGGRAVMADVDKDGAPEILFSGIYNGIDALVYCKNDGAGNFTREALSVTKLNGLFYDFADVDNDG
ncbi:MAG: VCBS repeat-containing protein, partial [Saprospiraceae bacterium]|nr:VCBS repeat-containing protein [Saprospiraceae bacterium]MCB0684327.1 VCBS repeat-containing protein [Saprospiraceae bacterium]